MATTTTQNAAATVVDMRGSQPVNELLVDALTRRDFAALEACLDEHVRFRALIPPGLVEHDNPADVAAPFAAWFGGGDTFEVVDTSTGQVGTKPYARWKVRMAPVGTPGLARIAEQHVYVTGGDRVESLDLLCSEFHRETASS